MVSRGKWAFCGENVQLIFSDGTVLSSRCFCSRVLLPSTWNGSVFSHYGTWVVTWLAAVAISEPSKNSCSLAGDLAPERLGWQQDACSLTPAPLFRGRGLASWGNRAVTVRMTASWHCSLLTTQMDSDESGGLLWVIVVTNPKRGGGLLSRDIRPTDWASGELHVTDQRLDGCLSYQAHEKELRDEAGGNGAQGGEAQQQTSESLRLTRVLHPLVLRQSHLSLLLQRLHVDWVR